MGTRKQQTKMQGGFPLPEYSSVARWSVQDVTNWLSQNKLKESVPNFRLAGVDGNKLLNCTDTDLIGISCPEKEVRIIINHIKQVDTPGRRFGASRYNKSDGYRRPPTPQNDSGDDSDGEGWGSDEFESDEYMEPEGSAPTLPSNRGRVPPIPPQPTKATPGRRKPPPRPPSPEEEIEQDDYMDPEPSPVPGGRPIMPRPLPREKSEELYEDPDQAVKVQNIHPGPLPPLPGNKSTNQKKPIPSSRQAPPKSRQASSRSGKITRQESTDTDDAETYDDPEENESKASKPPPVPANVPKRPEKKKTSPQPQNEQEVYDEPDVPDMAVPSVNKGKKSKGTKGKNLPPPPPSNDQQLYEEPDLEPSKSSGPPPVPRNVPKRPTVKLPATPPELEDYEEPDAPPPPPSRPTQPTKANKHPEPKKAPPPPDDQEVYEEPDVPAPTKPQPPPQIPSRKTTQHTPAVEQEVYEEPDVPAPTKPQPPPQIPSRKTTQHTPAVEQEVYEEPDVPSPTKPQPPPQGRLCPAPKYPTPAPPPAQDVYEIPDVEPKASRDVNGDSEDYLDMNSGGVQSHTLPSRQVSPASKLNKNNISASKKKPSPKPPVEEETYEEPDAPPKPPAPRKIQQPSKVNYTQVAIKTDKGEPKPVPTPVPASTGSLEGYNWFYGDTHRDVIRQRLEKQRTNGMYVIRNSTKSPTEPYTLQIFHQSKVYNLSIKKRGDNQYSIGSDNDKSFKTLLDLINFFKQNFLILHGGSQTKLFKSLPKE